MLILERFNYGIFDDDHPCAGTFGRLYMGDFALFTLEPPWLDNTPFLSCIPEGTYRLKLQYSNKIADLTNKKYLQGYEVMNVPNRTDILFHQLNYESQTDGCIGLGLEFGIMSDRLAIKDSQTAFELFMNTMTGDDVLQVRGYQCTYSTTLQENYHVTT